MKVLLGTLVVVISMTTSSLGLAATVFADGKHWRQLTETGGYSWDGLTAICPSGGGACSGALDGWTWATLSEVQSLFNSYNNGFVPNGGTLLVEASGSTWAPAFLADFTKTQGVAVPSVSGWTATEAASTTAYIGEVWDSTLTSFDDRMWTTPSPRTGSLPGRGVWLYETAPVPIPAAAWLFGSALLGLVAIKRKKA